MNIWYAAAASLLAVLALVHTVLGERYILRRLDKRDLPHLFGDDSFTKQTLRFVWHALTLVWLGVAASLVLNPTDAFVWMAVIVIAATAALTIIVSRGRHLSWAVELVAVTLLFLGLYQ